MVEKQNEGFKDLGELLDPHKQLSPEEEIRLRALRDSEPEDGYVELKAKIDRKPGSTVPGRQRHVPNSVRTIITELQISATTEG